jgi:hypothetical protein
MMCTVPALRPRASSPRTCPGGTAQGKVPYGGLVIICKLLCPQGDVRKTQKPAKSKTFVGCVSPRELEVTDDSGFRVVLPNIGNRSEQVPHF